MHKRRIGVLSALLVTAALILSAVPVVARSHLVVLLDGLSSPKGLSAGAGRSLVLGQGAYGPPGPILLYHLGGRARGTTEVLLDATSVTDLAVLPDGSGWAIGGDLILYHGDADGTITPVLNIPDAGGLDHRTRRRPRFQPGRAEPDVTPPRGFPPVRACRGP